MPSREESLIGQAVALHHEAESMRCLASTARRERDECLRALRHLNPEGWTHARLAAELGVSVPLVRKILYAN